MPNGLLREQIIAKEAELQDDRWNLTNVIVYYRENLPASRLDRLVYSGRNETRGGRRALR